MCLWVLIGLHVVVGICLLSFTVYALFVGIKEVKVSYVHVAYEINMFFQFGSQGDWGEKANKDLKFVKGLFHFI